MANGDFTVRTGEYTGPTYQYQPYQRPRDPYQRQLRRNLFQQIGQAGQLNPYLQQAGQQITQGQAMPALWQQAQGFIQQRLSPTYQAFGSDVIQQQLGTARQAISEQAERQRQAALNRLNQAGLYRSGFATQALQDVNEAELQALQRAATDIALQGAQATLAEQGRALQAALGLGGQQAGLAQQNLANLLGFGQYVQGQQLLPFQLGMEFYRGIVQPEAAQDFSQWLAQQQLQQSAAQQAFNQWLAQLQAQLERERIQAELAAAQGQAQGGILGSLIEALPLFFL